MMNNILWNITHGNSTMAGSRKLCKNKNYFNLNTMNGIVLIVYTMALMFLTNGNNTLETESNKIRCSDSMTCTKCTLTPECVWSLSQQECGNKNQFNSSNLISSKIEECPKCLVLTKDQCKNTTHIQWEYILKITNDLVHFMDFLKSRKIFLFFPTYSYEIPSNIINETDISFTIGIPNVYDDNEPTTTFFTIIKFNDVMLRFDNVADHYITVYKREECATVEKNTSCVICGWNKYGKLNYLKWCSSEDTSCTKNVYLENNATSELYSNVAYVTNDCAEINVTAVNPLAGSETGGTTVTITVRNHRILADNRTVMVTIAGTVCTNPWTSGLETITCTTSQSVGTPSGPIIVEYSSNESVLKIESSQIFHFCFNPVLDAEQQLGGIVSGGTSVPIHGSHFVQPCVLYSVRLYVELADGVDQYADIYCDSPVNDTYMVCRLPRLKGLGWDIDDAILRYKLNFGLNITFSKEEVSLNQSQSNQVQVHGPSLKFYVHPDPVLLDFEIKEFGTVIINGHDLQHVQPEDIEILTMDSPASGCVVVSVTPHSLECNSTMNVTELKVISVKFGNSLQISVNRKTMHHPEDPFKLPVWIFVIICMSTVLVFVCALACCLKIFYRITVTENIAKLPKVSTSSPHLCNDTHL